MSSAIRQRRFIKRPDDRAIKAEIEQLREEIKKLDATNQELSAQIDSASLDQNTTERRKKLQMELKEIVAKQGSFKTERNAVQAQIKSIETVMKKKIAEIQKVTSKHSFKNVADIDSKIQTLDESVGAGDLKLADERRLVKEMTSLRKLRKDFASIETQQESVDVDRRKIAELKKQISSIGNKDLQARFEEIQKELDEISSVNKSIYDKRGSLLKKRSEIKRSKDAKFDQIRNLRSTYDAEFAKFKEQLAVEQKRREEEEKEEREKEKQAKIREQAEKRLEEASVPAFTHEINEICTLLSYFDPSFVKPQKNAVAEATKPSFTGEFRIREVSKPDEGVVLMKKEKLSYFEGTKGKKSKKKAPKAKSLTVDPDVIRSLTDLSIPLPTKQEDVEGTIKVLKETLEALQSKQDEQTRVNIEKAKTEIANLKLEDSA